MNMFIFFSIYFLLAVAFGTYLAWSLLSATRVQRWGKALGAGAVVCILLLMPATILLRKAGHESALVGSVVWVGYLGMGFLSFLFCLAILRDTVRLVIGIQVYLKERIRNPKPSEPVMASPADPSRRRFLGYGVSTGITTVAAILTGVGVAEAMSVPDVREVNVPIENLPEDLGGFRIVQITDIHVSPTIHRPFVERVVDTVNRLQPDIVAHTGDLVDGSVKRLAYHVEPLSRLRSTYGSFFVTGNHEYYSGADQWIRKVKDLGHRVLLNEHRIIRHGNGRLLVAGVTDYRAGNFNPHQASSPARALRGAEPAHVKLLLAHQPKSIYEAAAAGFDLQISGHTHGGQFWPWPILVRLTQPFIAGLHRFENTQVYVSRGTGYWGPPIRFGAPSEITLIKLVQI
ncbi:putative phosphoesterase [Olavius algarvensis associated proteobacterium Delta 3]|nr:putative phosphoesterase [Olavius algarvensis associated proteobacterium Delta 3]